MGIYTIKPKFQQFLSPITNYFISHRVSPNAINLWGLVLSIITGLCLYFSYLNHWLLLLVPFLVFIRTAFNALDGLVSRKLGLASKFGEVLNELLDRISDTIIFLSLALAPFSNLIVGSIVVVVILLNSYLSIVSKAAGGSRQYGGIMGKADRMIYLGIMSLIVFFTNNTGLWYYFFWFTLIGTTITFIQRFFDTKKELNHA